MQQRAFPCAGFPDDGQHFALPHIERQVFKEH
jgi:hypothetical protein